MQKTVEINLNTQELNAQKNHFFNRRTLTLMILGVLVAFTVHQIEISSTNLGWQLHETADDASYVRPALNFWDYGTWKDNSVGPSSYVQRPPLTGILHLLGFLMTGRNNVLGFFIIALILHGFAVAFFEKIMRQFINPKAALITTVIFILSPCFYGFLSYAISEAIYLPFLLLGFYFGLVPQKVQFQKLLIALLLLYLLRPVLILFILPLILFHLLRLIRNRGKGEKSIFVTSSLILLIFANGFWEFRKFNYISSFSPHPIYHAKNESIFRPPHESMTRLFKLWEYQPEVFHQIILQTDTAEATTEIIKEYIAEKEVPMRENQFKQLLQLYQTHIAVNQREQAVFCNDVDQFTDSLLQKNKWQYWIKTPCLSLKENITKSHLNLGIFQDKYRGNMFIEGLRYLTLALLLLGYFCLPLVFFSQLKPELKLLSLGTCFYLLFLIEYQRMNEDRYFLPAAFTGFMILWILTFRLSEHFLNRRKVDD